MQASQDMLDQECLWGASVASVKEEYQPVNTKRDNNKVERKTGRKTGRKRERRTDSSACEKFKIQLLLKADHFVLCRFVTDSATVVSVN